MAGVVGAFGDFVFSVHDRGGSTTFNALSCTRNSRLVTHTTVEGLPVVEFLGLDAETVKLSGVLSSEISGNVDVALDDLRALQDGIARPLTRGPRYYGLFYVRSFTFSEDRWAGGSLAVATWTMDLIATRDS